MKPLVAILPVSEAPSDLFWGKTYVGSLYAILREELGVEVDVGSAHFWHPRKGVDVILIQWPEALFEWREIGDEDVARWWQAMRSWRQLGTKVVYIRHNFRPHNLVNSAYKALYQGVIEGVDAVVHLGQYSRDECIKYEGVEHRVIQHPKYSMQLPDHGAACARLGLDEDRPTMLIYGAIRHMAELKIALRAAKLFRAEFEGQVLFGTAPLHLLGRWSRFVRPFVPLMKRHWTRSFGAHFHEGRLNGMIEEDYLAVSQFILVPRLDGQLNSGVLIKSLSLGITPIATSVGNLAGIGKEVGLPMLEDVTEESLRYLFRHALDQQIELSDFWKSHSEEAWGRAALAEPLSKLFEDLNAPTKVPTETKVAQAAGWTDRGLTGQRRALKHAGGGVIRRLPKRI